MSKTGHTSFDTVLLHSNRRKYLSKIPKDINDKRIEMWTKGIKNFSGISDAISPRYIRKNPRNMNARVPHPTASKTRDSPNTRNGVTPIFLNSLFVFLLTKMGAIFCPSLKLSINVIPLHLKGVLALIYKLHEYLRL